MWIEVAFTCGGTAELFEVVTSFTEISPNVFTGHTEELFLNSTQVRSIQASHPYDEIFGLYFPFWHCSQDNCLLSLRLSSTYSCSADVTMEIGRFLDLNKITTVWLGSKYLNLTSSRKLFALSADRPSVVELTSPLEFQLQLKTQCFEPFVSEQDTQVALPAGMTCLWVGSSHYIELEIAVHDNPSQKSEDSSQPVDVITIVGLAAISLFCCLVCLIMRSVFTSGRVRHVRASEVQIQDTTSITIFDQKKKKQYMKRKAEARCSICLEYYSSDEELRKLPCNHEFHRVCVDIWLRHFRNRCPICVQTLQEARNFHQKVSCSPSRLTSLSPSPEPFTFKDPFTNVVRTFDYNDFVAEDLQVLQQDEFEIKVDRPSQSVEDLFDFGGSYEEPLSDEPGSHERSMLGIFSYERSISRTRSPQSRSPRRRSSHSPWRRSTSVRQLFRRRTSLTTEVTSVEYIE